MGQLRHHHADSRGDFLCAIIDVAHHWYDLVVRLLLRHVPSVRINGSHLRSSALANLYHRVCIGLDRPILWPQSRGPETVVL